MSEITLTSQNFSREVLESDIPVLVDFWATWCGPCRMIAPLVADIAEEYEGKLKVGKVNVDEQQALAMKFQIVSIPTIIFFKDGKVAETVIGYHTKEQLEKVINGI